MKNTAISIILIIISLLIIGTGIFMTISNNIKNTNKVKDTPLTPAEKSQNISPILEQILYYNTYLSKEYPIKDINSLSNTTKTHFLLNVASSLGETKISTKELKKLGKKYFTKFKIITKDIKSTNKTLYKYKDGNFVSTNSEEHIYTTNITEQQITANKNNWIITAKIYYSTIKYFNQTNIEKSIYNDLNQIKKHNPIFIISSDLTNYQENIPPEINKGLKKVTYHFKKYEETYKLTSILFE